MNTKSEHEQTLNFNEVCFGLRNYVGLNADVGRSSSKRRRPSNDRHESDIHDYHRGGFLNIYKRKKDSINKASKRFCISLKRTKTKRKRNQNETQTK